MKTSTKLIVNLITCVAIFSAGLSVRQPPQVITKEVYVYVKVPVYKELKQTKYFGQQRDLIAAAIPASALTPPKPKHKPSPELAMLTYKKGE